MWQQLALAMTNLLVAAMRLWNRKPAPKPPEPTRRVTLQDVAKSLEPGESVVQTKSPRADDTPLSRPVIPPNPYGVEN